MDGFEVSLLRLARCQGDAFLDAVNDTRIGCDPTPVGCPVTGRTVFTCFYGIYRVVVFAMHGIGNVRSSSSSIEINISKKELPRLPRREIV